MRGKFDPAKADALARGLTRFLCDPCPKGHQLRYTDGHCVECTKEKRRTVYRAREREQLKRWRKQNEGTYQGNPCRYGHPGLRYPNGSCVDCHRESHPQKYKANGEYIRKRNRKYAQNNPDVMRACSDRRRARKMNAEGSYSREDIARIKEKQGNRCVYCPTKFGKYEVDHIVALSRGGSNHPENIQLLCRTCNRSKCAKDPLDFARSLGLLV